MHSYKSHQHRRESKPFEPIVLPDAKRNIHFNSLKTMAKHYLIQCINSFGTSLFLICFKLSKNPPLAPSIDTLIKNSA